MGTPESSMSGLQEPAWEVAHLFPAQGQWTESEFFELHSNRMVELADGTLEILPLPTWLHQLMVDFLADLLKRQVANGTDGHVMQAPLPVRLFPNTIREPDVMYFAPGSEPSDPRGYPEKVDLAMEVVSEARKPVAVTPRTSGATMPELPLQNTGSSTLRTRRSSFSHCRTTSTRLMACSQWARLPADD